MTDSTSTHFDPDAELDLTGEGLQPVTADCLIVSGEIKDVEFGQKWEIVLEPLETIDGLPNNQVKDNGFLSYDGPSEHDLAKIGRGILKRIFVAVLGTANARISDLVGQKVNVKIREDNAGFARAGNYRAVRD